MGKNECRVRGCERETTRGSAFGLCSLHYQRYNIYGDVDSRYEAKISDTDKSEKYCKSLAKNTFTEEDREYFKRASIYRQARLEDSLDEELYVDDLLRQIDDKGFI